MMGTSHAATGLLAGAALGAMFGSHPADYFVLAAVGAGAALLPDLDEPGSTVGRSLGPITRGLSRLLRGASQMVFTATGTRADLASSTSGGHRHLTHTLPAVVAFGALGWVLSLAGAWGLPLVVFAMTALGIGVVYREVSGQSKTDAQLTAAVVGVVAATAAVILPGGAPWLVGVTVAVGALVHILGDWLTRAGVPLAWPLKHRGKRWWMFRSPLAFRTGEESVAEKTIRTAALLGAPAIGVLTYVPISV